MNGPAHSGGGPFVVIPEQQAARWRGFEEEPEYERACRGGDHGSILGQDYGQVLVLGTPDDLYWRSLDDGGIFVRAVSLADPDSAAFEQVVAAVPDSGWQPIGEWLVPGGTLLAFDAAMAGDSAEGISLHLPAGRYALSWKTHAAPGCELLVNRLRRIGT